MKVISIRSYMKINDKNKFLYDKNIKSFISDFESICTKSNYDIYEATMNNKDVLAFDIDFVSNTVEDCEYLFRITKGLVKDYFKSGIHEYLRAEKDTLFR